MPKEPLALPVSLTAHRTGDLAETLRKELLANLWKLPLETLCQKGGWPHADGMFSLHEIAVEDNGNTLTIRCEVGFEEVVPSCCAGGVITDHHLGKMTISIKKDSALAEVVIAEL